MQRCIEAQAGYAIAMPRLEPAGSKLNLY